MSSRLPSVSNIVSSTWKQFTCDWTKSLHITIWLGIPTMLGILMDFINWQNVSNREYTGALVLDISIIIVIAIVSFVLNVITPIRLIRFAFARIKGSNQTKTDWLWHLFGPMIWIAILTILIAITIFLASALIGTIAGILLYQATGSSQNSLMIGIGLASILSFCSLIYSSIRFTFASIFLIENNAHGRASLRASWNLTKGRFWAIFWCQLCIGIIFGLAYIFIALILIAIVLALYFLIQPQGSTWKSMFDNTNTLIGTTATSIVLLVIYRILSTAIIVGTAPFPIIYQVRLFDAIKK